MTNDRTRWPRTPIMWLIAGQHNTIARYSTGLRLLAVRPMKPSYNDILHRVYSNDPKVISPVKTAPARQIWFPFGYECPVRLPELRHTGTRSPTVSPSPPGPTCSQRSACRSKFDCPTGNTPESVLGRKFQQDSSFAMNQDEPAAAMIGVGASAPCANP